MAKFEKVLSQSKIFWGFALIFVTLGNDKHKFSRLLDQINLLSEQMKDQKFIVQKGHTDFQDRKNIFSKRFFDKDTFYKIIKEASLIISHAGAGTLFKLVQEGKKPIVVPRLSNFDEHLNDHQLEIANEFKNRDLCYLINKIENLNVQLVKKSLNKTSIIKTKKNNKLLMHLSNDFKKYLS